MKEISRIAQDCMIPRPRTPSKYVDLLRHDFEFFAQETFLALDLFSHHEFHPIDREALRYFQHGGTAIGLLMPRGWGKTWAITMNGGLWELFRNPAEATVLIISAGEEHAKNIMRTMRTWVNRVPHLRHLAPSNIPEDRHIDTELAFNVGPSYQRPSPSCTAIGGTGQITGKRASVVITDDLETPLNSRTITARDAIMVAFNELPKIASYGDKRIVIVGTIQHESDSCYARVAHQGMVNFRSYPMLVPTPKQAQAIMGLSPTVERMMDQRPSETPERRMVFPHRYTRDQLASYLALGATEFNCHYMQMAKSDGGSRYPLSLKDLIVPDFQIERDMAPSRIVWGMTAGNDSTVRTDIQTIGRPGDRMHRQWLVSPETSPYNATIMAIDPAGTGEDRIGYAIVGAAMGYLWVKAAGSIKGPLDLEARATLVRMAKRHGATDIYVEEPFGGNSSNTELLSLEVRSQSVPRDTQDYPRGWSALVTPHKAKGGAHSMRKHERICAALETVMANHRLVIDTKAIEPIENLEPHHQLQWQISNITRERNSIPHDDAIDALAMAVVNLSEHIGVDSEAAIEQRRIHDLDEKIRSRFRGKLAGKQRPVWNG